MIEIERFDKEKHQEMIRRWFSLRDLSLYPADELPELGLVASFETLPIGMIFLRRLENSNTAMIDGLITYPSAPASLRNIAIDLLVQEIIKLAKELKMHQIVANSVDRNTLERALRHKFQHLPHTLMTLNLL